MTDKIQKALEDFKKVLCEELSDTCTCVNIVITAHETNIETNHRTAQQLKDNYISMKNIKGNWIK